MERGNFSYTADRRAASRVVRLQTYRQVGRQRLLLGVLILAVVTVDQTTKWWAWRHSGTVTINPGGDELVGNLVGSWFRSSAGGAVLDVVDAAVLAGALGWITRRRRPTPVLLSSALAVAGWVSNLSDRLGLHYWTAPGSVRGAVDFLRAGPGAVYNGADVAIVAGTACLGVSLYCYRRKERALRALEAASRVPRPGRSSSRWSWLLVTVLVVALLAFYGVGHPGWVYAPPRLWSAG